MFKGFAEEGPDGIQPMNIARLEFVAEVAERFGIGEAFVFVKNVLGPIAKAQWSSPDIRPMMRTVNGEEYAELLIVPRMLKSYVWQDATFTVDPSKSGASRYHFALVDRKTTLWTREQEGWKQ
jgi:hypothetical protein